MKYSRFMKYPLCSSPLSQLYCCVKTLLGHDVTCALISEANLARKKKKEEEEVITDSG